MKNKLNPTHYLVVQSPYAELLVTGVKIAEYRSWASRLAGKTVAIAVGRKPGKLKELQEELQEELEIWKPSVISKRLTEDLFAKRLNGKIIGAVRFHALEELQVDLGDAAIVDEAEVWCPDEFLDSPGGLGLRKIPK